MARLIGLLADLGVATGVTHSAVIYAIVSALNLLAIGLLLGPILIVDLALLGRVRRPDA